MIRIDRHRVEKGQKIEPSAAWLAKAKDLTQLAKDEGANHVVLDHYRHDDLKVALEALFFDKCAYCETRLGVAGSWDVEHFRPKGRVAERLNHHGYFWLAYSWENLYPACELCNQRRKDLRRWNDPLTGPTLGKFDQFPLEAEAQRAMTWHDDLSLEKPLLIDPCDPDEDPEAHFTFDIHGQIQARSKNDRRARETIRICHLQRRRLRDDRSRVLAAVIKIVELIGKAKAKGEAGLELGLRELLEESYLSPSAPYAALSRAVANDPAAFLPPTS